MSKSIQIAAFIESVQKRKLAPVYMATGDETFLHDLVYRHARNGILDEAEQDFNLDIFYGDELNPQTLSASLTALPMMSMQRVIIIKKADSLSTQTQNYLLEYADKPSPENVLILLHNGEATSAWGKKFVAKVVTIKCATPSARELPDWIRRYAESLQVKIHDDAIELMSMMPGIRLSEIATEMEKASLLVAEGEEVNSSHIQELWGIQPEVNIWTFFDHAASGSRQSTFKDFNNLKSEFEDDRQIGFFLSQIGRKVRLAWRERLYDAQGVPAGSREWSGKTQFQWQRSSSALKTSPLSYTIKALNDLVEFDSRRKTESVQPVYLFEALLHQLALKREKGRTRS